MVSIEIFLKFISVINTYKTIAIICIPILLIYLFSTLNIFSIWLYSRVARKLNKKKTSSILSFFNNVSITNTITTPIIKDKKYIFFILLIFLTSILFLTVFIYTKPTVIPREIMLMEKITNS